MTTNAAGVAPLERHVGRHPCEVAPGEFDHDMQWRSDWYGDPGVIGGTADCSSWVCRACGLEDTESEPPEYDYGDDY